MYVLILSITPVNNSYNIKLLKNIGTTCTIKVDINKCIPSLFCSFTSSCILGLFINIVTKNTSVVNMYVSKLLGPNLINVEIKEITYIIPTGIFELSAAAIIAIPNGVIENITLSELIFTIDTIKVIIYKIMFCFVNNFLNISFTSSFLFTFISRRRSFATGK